jgi:hypothetical protein
MVRSTAGGTIGTVTCPGSIATTAGHFAVGRIEVIATNQVHFMIDNDASDGVNLMDCGTVTGTLPVSSLAPFLEDNQSAAQGATHVVEIDYARIWQDDAASSSEGLTSQASDNTVSFNSVGDDAPLTAENTDIASNSELMDFSTATSDDQMFSNDVYVKGTLYADKIKANQIEGLELLTDKISSLQDEVAQKQTTPTSATPGLTAGGTVNLSDLQAVNLVVLAQIESKGGLVVDKDATFNGKTIFQLLAEFNGNVNFNKQVTFNANSGGFITIKKGAQKVQVKYTAAYADPPIVVANWSTDSDDSDAQAALFEAGYNFLITKSDEKGFWIYLNKPADQDVKLNWIATAVKDAKITASDQNAQ